MLPLMSPPVMSSPHAQRPVPSRALLPLALVLASLFAALPGHAQADPAAALRALIEEDRHGRAAPGQGAASPPVSAERERQEAERARALLERVDAIDATALSADDRVDRDMFRRDIESRVMDYTHGAWLMPVNHESGPHSSFMRLPARSRLATVEDYDSYIARLRGAREHFEPYVVLMREGLRTGFTPAQAVLGGHETMIDAYLAQNPAESPLYQPFAAFPAAVPETERARLRAEGIAAIRDGAYAALAQFRDFLTQEYIPGARTGYGILELPGGREYYDHLVRYHTTLDITAEEVHEIGLAEVARIRSEMEQIIASLGFDGSFGEFLEFLRTDPRFYVDTPRELLREAAFIAKRVDGLLPSVFHLHNLPRRPYGVAPVPADLAPNYTGGRYSGSSRPDQAGFYWVNTYDLPSRPLYVLPALTLHEAVPGHHLQIALNQEMELRRRGGVTAFSEGWALYAEYLGREMGIYDDPYTDFGRLTYEMWRACRLVVDTGVHAFGWDRDRVRQFLADNTALSFHEVRTETDRYIAVPGQALAYKMGELTIRRLRTEAEAALGDTFDVRDYHDVVLRNGPVPLRALEDNVRAWLADTAAAATATRRP
jgi:uncharacterized protein (DUF885 family)